MSKFNNKPTYTKEVLLPKHLDITVKEANQLKEFQIDDIIELIRIRMIELIENNHPPFSSGLSEEKIIENLKKLNFDNKNKLYKPILASRIYRSTDLSLADGILKHSHSSASAINHWFFEMFKSKVASGLNPLTQFYNTDMFNRNMNAVIKKNKFGILLNHPDYKLSKCLDAFRIINGAKPVYNYPPDLAKWIYLRNAKRIKSDSKDYNILDTSIGWGSRLAGALAACNSKELKDKTVRYFGTDVNSSIFDQYRKFLSYWIKNINPKIKFKFYNAKLPAEEILNDEYMAKYINKFDIAFTSPPYFSCEQYSDDEGQSYIKYPQYDVGGENSWREGFLKKMIENTFKLLKPGGEFWLNIANIRNNENITKSPMIYLEDDAMKYAKSAGFKHIWTYKMELKNIYNITEKQRRKSSSKRKTDFNNVLYILDENLETKQIKYEPIFVFQKPMENNNEL